MKKLGPYNLICHIHHFHPFSINYICYLDHLINNQVNTMIKISVIMVDEIILQPQIIHS
jgi:hypothetical protein